MNNNEYIYTDSELDSIIEQQLKIINNYNVTAAQIEIEKFKTMHNN
jgi:hypothetical protein